MNNDPVQFQRQVLTELSSGSGCPDELARSDEA
jgi:hypothetical protein